MGAAVESFPRVEMNAAVDVFACIPLISVCERMRMWEDDETATSPRCGDRANYSNLMKRVLLKQTEMVSLLEDEEIFQHHCLRTPVYFLPTTLC